MTERHPDYANERDTRKNLLQAVKAAAKSLVKRLFSAPGHPHHNELEADPDLPALSLSTCDLGVHKAAEAGKNPRPPVRSSKP